METRSDASDVDGATAGSVRDICHEGSDVAGGFTTLNFK